MKIIKRGTPPEEVTYNATCYKCKTEIEFQRCEAKFSSNQFDGSMLSIECPVCGSMIHKTIQ